MEMIVVLAEKYLFYGRKQINPVTHLLAFNMLSLCCTLLNTDKSELCADFTLAQNLR
jgi:hypothetical protein